MRQLLKLTKLTNNYSQIHIQMSFIQAELRAPEHLEGTFVPWATGRQLPPPKLPTVVWHSSCSQLQAMWHSAFFISSANELAFLFTRWKGCKLRLISANTVVNRTLLRVCHSACSAVSCLLAGAQFGLLACSVLASCAAKWIQCTWRHRYNVAQNCLAKT